MLYATDHSTLMQRPKAFKHGENTTLQRYKLNLGKPGAKTSVTGDSEQLRAVTQTLYAIFTIYTEPFCSATPEIMPSRKDNYKRAYWLDAEAWPHFGKGVSFAPIDRL